MLVHLLHDQLSCTLLEYYTVLYTNMKVITKFSDRNFICNAKSVFVCLDYCSLCITRFSVDLDQI